MIDIRNFNTSLKVNWTQGYLDSDNKGKWKVFFDYYLESNLQERDAKQLVIQDPFVKEVIEYWTITNYREKNLEFELAYIRHNALITIFDSSMQVYRRSSTSSIRIAFFSFDEF